MNNRFYKAFIALWVALLMALGIYYVAFAPRDGAYSEQENRTLTAFPELNSKTLFSGDFGREMENYLLDHFPARDQVIASSNRLYGSLSFASHEEYLQIAEGPTDPLDSGDYESDLGDLLQDFGTRPTEPVSTDPVETEPEVTEPVENPPIEPKPAASLTDYPATLATYMDVGGGVRAMSSYSRDNVAAVTAVLNKYARLLPENGKLMFTVVPQANCGNQFVNAQNKEAFYADWDDLVNGLGDDNVYAFDSAEILSEAIRRDEYVYFRTDMHWTPYGSYLVYCQMALQAGKTPASYTEDFTLTVEEPFRGTYYRDNPGVFGYVQPDRLDLLMPNCGLEWRRTTGPEDYRLIDFLDFNARANDRYTVYLGGPAGPWTYAQCDNGQEEHCLLITDSFGLGYLPFLTANYSQVHYYDPRYFDQGYTGAAVAQLIEKYQIQDIYVVVGDLHSFNSGFLITTANSQLGQ